MSIPLVRSTDGSALATTWAYRQILASAPFIQYGTATGTGGTGTVTVTIPISYATISSYVVTVTMNDSPASQVYATQTSPNTFTLGWQSAGAGTHKLMWISVGT